MTRDERSATLRAGCASSAPADARAFVARTGQSWELPEPVIEAAQLATSELVSNSVEHALSGVQVTLALADDQLRIAVRDHSKSPPVRRIPNTSGARGRGIALVEAVAQEWGVLPHPDGKTVWLVLPATGNGLVPADGTTAADSTAKADAPVSTAQTASTAKADAPAGAASTAQTGSAVQTDSPAKADTALAEDTTPAEQPAATPANATPTPATVSATPAAAAAEGSVLERPEVVEVPEHAAE